MIFRYLECFLQITGQQVDEIILKTEEFKNIALDFLGAINSPKFTTSSFAWRYKISNVWLQLLSHLHSERPKLQHVTIKPSSLSLVPALKNLVDKFENMSLNEEKIWLWRAWPTTNKNGRNSFLPLYPVYERLGRTFVENLYQVCDAYFRSRRAALIPGLMPLTRFIGKYPKPIYVNDFHQADFVTTFWQEFFIYFVTTSYDHGNGAQISSIVTAWRNQILFFIKEHLQASGLFAAPLGELPSPEPKTVAGANTHIKKQKDGKEIRTKLLTDIPLEVTDEQAIQLLFRQIERDVSIIRAWAQNARDDLWKRHQRRQELAPAGQVRFVRRRGGGKGADLPWLTERDNPHCLENACATFEHYKFRTNEEINLALLYPQPLNKTAGELGLPTTDALLPHCFLLVLEHPAITPSFLENLELYDRNGKLVGLHKNDGEGYQLKGFKNRKGHRLASQIITLSETATQTVEQIIQITEPVRMWLREKGNDNWRYLLLSCGQGFATPRRVGALSTSTSKPQRKNSLATSISTFADLPQADVLPLVERLSLPAARSSAGVLVYLKTKSVEKMSIALGHTYYNPKLLERYLPKEIREFFQERWIRIFQAGIIVEALKDSTYLLDASDFENIDQLYEFLSNHAIRTVSESRPEVTPGGDNMAGRRAEIVFGVNANVLTALLSLEIIVKKSGDDADPRAKYWADVGKQLISHIETRLQHRADLCSFVAEARLKAVRLDMNGVENG